MKQEAMAFSDRKQGIQKARVKEDMEEVRFYINSFFAESRRWVSNSRSLIIINNRRIGFQRSI